MYVVLIVKRDLALCGLIGAQFSPKRHPSVRPSLVFRRVSRTSLRGYESIGKILMVLHDSLI